MTERAGCHLLRAVFGLGLWAALFFTVAGVNFGWPTETLAAYFVLAGLAAGALLWLACRIWPDFLRPAAGASTARILGLFVLLLPLSFIVLTVPFGILGYAEVALTWSDPGHSQAGLHVVLVALWYGAWWAFLPALLLSWRRSGRREVK